MKNGKNKDLFSWIKSILFAFVIVFICQKFIFVPRVVEGVSMNPTFENNNKIIVSKISKIEHFDMIVFHSPVSNDDYIKRVIGLPGDVVEMKNDVLTINGKVYKEFYLKSNKKSIPAGQKLTENFKIKVPKDKLFVMGDNRRKSFDSRRFGVIPKNSVVGEVKFRYYPLNEIEFTK